MSIRSVCYKQKEAMSRLSVLTYPHKCLQEVSKPLKDIPTSIQGLVRDMFETMYIENGIGLAAPQIGESIRLVVMDVARPDPLNPEQFLKDPLALINPEIILSEGLIQYEEGCLSCPELAVLVDRSAKIKVNYLNLEGKPLTLEMEGLKAVCVQHEIDHLNGILLVNKLSRLKRDLYKQKRLRIAKEEKDLATIL